MPFQTPVVSSSLLGSDPTGRVRRSSRVASPSASRRDHPYSDCAPRFQKTIRSLESRTMMASCAASTSATSPGWAECDALADGDRSLGRMRRESRGFRNEAAFARRNPDQPIARRVTVRAQTCDLGVRIARAEAPGWLATGYTWTQLVV